MNRLLLSLLILLSFINICSGLKCNHCSSTSLDACTKSQTSKTCTGSSAKCYNVVKTTTAGKAAYARGCTTGTCTTAVLCPNTTTCVVSCCTKDNCNKSGAEMLQQGILPLLSAVVLATLYIVL